MYPMETVQKQVLRDGEQSVKLKTVGFDVGSVGDQLDYIGCFGKVDLPLQVVDHVVENRSVETAAVLCDLESGLEAVNRFFIIRPRGMFTREIAKVVASGAESPGPVSVNVGPGAYVVGGA